MRGNTTTSNFFRLLPGFIPAHAGNTVPYGHVPGLCQVHPRPCVEYEIHDLTKALIQGSPPLTRGIRRESRKTRLSTRFTPAHAGNTTPVYKTGIHIKVHPRSRGEYGWSGVQVPGGPGSPPLTRGILLLFSAA